MFTPLVLPSCKGRIRQHIDTDLPWLTRHASDPEVPRFLRNAFPSPYTESDARKRLAQVKTEPVLEGLALELDGEFAGTMACWIKEDVMRFTGEIGYWLARPFWGRGIMTEAVRVFSEHLLTQENLLRLEALVYEPNIGSARVLEKAGFTLEARFRKAIYKHGRFMDGLLFSRIRGDAP